MIDPTQMTEYGASTHRLEEIALFSVCAANNNAHTAAKGLEKMLNRICDDLGLTRTVSPFALIRRWYKHVGEDRPTFRQLLAECGIGKHLVKHRAVLELAHSGLNLRTCEPEELEKIHGIKYKTSRFFILHTRPGVRLPALDTHMLAYMRDQGLVAPKNTPSSSKRYRQLSEQFLALADASGKTLAEFDLDIWNERSRKKSGNGKL